MTEHFELLINGLSEAGVKMAEEKGHVTINKNGKRRITERGKGYYECLMTLSDIAGGQDKFRQLLEIMEIANNDK